MKKYVLFLTLMIINLISIASPKSATDVFHLSARASDPNTLMLHWTIQPGYFLYQNSIHIIKPAASDADIGSVHLPVALKKTNTTGTSYRVYRNELVLPLAFLGKEPGESMLQIKYQGCSDEGFCYPPQQNTIKVTIDASHALSDVTIEHPEVALTPSPNTSNSSIDSLFSKQNGFIIILSFFGFGVLLAFTPCVLPMIPILSGIIIGHGAQLSTRKAFFLSLSYVLSMSITYGLIGAIFAFMGNNLQIIMQSPWAIGFFSLLFVLLALSMFNVYDLRLPMSWQATIARLTRSQSGGHYIGAAIMGALSILILSPCVTAPLIGALSYIADQGSISLGVLALFFLGLGMGTPLLLIGTSAGKILPKAGAWMNQVKTFFGILLLGVAIYLLDRILPHMIIMILSASLLIFSGIYLGVFQHAKTSLEKGNQGLGFMMLVYGFLILVGASQGHDDPLHPLKNEIQHTQTNLLSTTNTVTTLTEAKAVLASARLEKKPVMIDFYADWCLSCKLMAKTTFRDPQVVTALQSFVVLTIDVTKNTADTQALLSYFKTYAPPTFLFYDANGRELNTLRIIGDVSADFFVKQLRSVSLG